MTLKSIIVEVLPHMIICDNHKDNIKQKGYRIKVDAVFGNAHYLCRLCTENLTKKLHKALKKSSIA